MESFRTMTFQSRSGAVRGSAPGARTVATAGAAYVPNTPALFSRSMASRIRGSSTVRAARK